MSIVRVNRSKTKYCILRNGIKMWNSLLDALKVNVSFLMFNSKCTKFLSRKIIENIDDGQNA